MLSWRAFTREAARLPSSMRPSMRLRRAEMIAISLPEKKPLPEQQQEDRGGDEEGLGHGLERPCYQRKRPRRRLAPARGL